MLKNIFTLFRVSDNVFDNILRVIEVLGPAGLHGHLVLVILPDLVLELTVQIIDVELPRLDEVGGVEREQLPLGFFSIEVRQIYLETTCVFTCPVSPQHFLVIPRKVTFDEFAFYAFTLGGWSDQAGDFTFIVLSQVGKIWRLVEQSFNM